MIRSTWYKLCWWWWTWSCDLDVCLWCQIQQTRNSTLFLHFFVKAQNSIKYLSYKNFLFYGMKFCFLDLLLSWRWSNCHLRSNSFNESLPWEIKRVECVERFEMTKFTMLTRKKVMQRKYIILTHCIRICICICICFLYLH